MGYYLGCLALAVAALLAATACGDASQETGRDAPRDAPDGSEADAAETSDAPPDESGADAAETSDALPDEGGADAAETSDAPPDESGADAAPCEPDSCNGHGPCVAGVCSCDPGYAGARCEICTAGYTGYPDCIEPPAVRCGGADRFTVTELLADPTFANGIQMGLGTYPDKDACRARWMARLPTLRDAYEETPWYFIEVGEKTLLCDRDDNPSVDGSIVYTNPTDRGTPADSKRLDDRRSTTQGVELAFDTGQEWRAGCALNLPDRSGVAPRYGAETAEWNWPHLLIAQTVADPRDASRRLLVDRYDKLTFEVTLRLAESRKASSPEYDAAGNCPEWQNHALFYIGFSLAYAPDPWSRLDRLIYAIFPVWYTYDGTSYHEPSGPWAGGDPAGSKVYWTAMVGAGRKYEPLVVGREQTYSMDLLELVAEAVGGCNQSFGTSWSTADYFVYQVYIGWEIWGGYETNVTIRNPSLKAFHHTEHDCPTLHRYWNASIGDHYYTTDYIPGGFMGYDYEGAAARMPAIRMSGTARLWRYWYATGGDHYYSTNLQPFGLGGGWAFERQAGNIFVADPGVGYEVFEEWWCTDNADHLYQLASWSDPTWCYAGPDAIGWLATP